MSTPLRVGRLGTAVLLCDVADLFSTVDTLSAADLLCFHTYIIYLLELCRGAQLANGWYGLTRECV